MKEVVVAAGEVGLSNLRCVQKIKKEDGLDKQRIEGHPWLGESGLRFIPVPHEGNQNSSAEEVEAVAGLVHGLMQSTVKWIDDKGQDRPLQLSDILIVAPYNAQG